MLSFFKKKEKEVESIIIGAPCKGKAVALTEVNDPTFSQEMLGPGTAIIPSEGKFYAPVDGTVDMVFETLHAITMRTEEDVEILIHVGLDTVARKGAGYKAYVQDGDSVKKGDLLLEADLEAIKADGYDIITPVVICNGDDFGAVKSIICNKEVEPQDELIIVEK